MNNKIKFEIIGDDDKPIVNGLEMNHIKYFFDSNSKEENDSTNRIRETILTSILELPEYYFDGEFGTEWLKLKTEFLNALSSLCPYPYSKIRVIHKGGMTFNYDFEVEYLNLDEKSPVYSQKVEFKNNNMDVKNLPQFLELYDSDCKSKYGLFTYSYSEFYYDKYLSNYLNIDGLKDTLIDISKEQYLQYVKDIKYKQPFFRILYDNKNINKKEKEVLVKKSKQEFLETYSNCFNFTELTNKIKESQTDKVYLMWDKNKFNSKMLKVKDIDISGIKQGSITDTCFDISVNNFEYDIRVRLNWGNNNGIANPRWKFTFIDK